MTALTYTPSVVGFSPLPTPAAGTRIAYVAANGNDSTGALVAASGIADVFNPTSGENPTPFANIAAAHGALRSGEADWVLMKRGDVWDYTDENPATSFLSWSKFGPSSSARVYVGWYGDLADERPKMVFPHKQNIFLNAGGVIWRNIDWRGITIEADDIVSQASNQGTFAFRLLSLNSEQPMRDFSFEDMYFHRSHLLVQNATSAGFMTGLVVRRNVFHDSYGSAALLVGYDNVVWEENIAVDTGLRRSLDNPNGEGLDAQCWYFQDLDNQPSANGIVCVGNVGTSVASNLVQARAGGVVSYNVAHLCPMPLAGLARFESHDAPNGDYLECVGNLVVECNDMPENRGARGWGIDSSRPASGSKIEDNILCTNYGGEPNGIIVGSAYEISVARNVLYDFRNCLSLQGTINGPITFADNIFYIPNGGTLSGRGLIRIRTPAQNGEFDYADFVWTNNTYYAPQAQSGWFKDWGVSGPSSFADWVTASGETGQIDATDPWTREAAPVMASYYAGLSGIANLAQYKAALVGQREGNWRTDIMAVPTINWFRDGFGLNAVSTEMESVTNAAPAWQTIPRQSVAEGATATLDLSGYVSDADEDAITLSEVGTWPTWASLSGTVVTLTPEVGDASGTNYTFDVRATDDGLPIRTADATITVTVTEEADVDPPSGEPNPSVLYSGVISFVIYGGKG